MNLIKAGSEAFNWNINLSEVARIWQGGCIIRAKFLGKIKEAYLRDSQLQNLLLDEELNGRIEQAQPEWRIVVSTAMQQGIPMLAMASTLGYFDMYRTANLPLNLTQAQRDFFGSHTYRRADKPEAGPIHTEWEELPPPKPHQRNSRWRLFLTPHSSFQSGVADEDHVARLDAADEGE